MPTANRSGPSVSLSILVPFLGICLLAVLFPADTLAEDVRNVRARQEGSRFLFEYDLDGPPREVIVILRLTIDGKTYGPKNLHLDGSIGKVRPGKSLRINWDVIKDFPRGLSGEISWDIRALGGTVADPKTGMEFVLVEGGCFRAGEITAGSAASAPSSREICVPDFYIGKHEVTQGQWEKVMQDNPSHFRAGSGHPVEQVSWHDAESFTGRLGALSGEKYRLPTEAEWEYAARGGRKDRWAGTGNKANLGDYAWYGANSGGSTHPVGKKRSNALGIHDMSGNVWEWCSDAYTGGEGSPAGGQDAAETGGKGGRGIRGGSWFNEPQDIQVSARSGEDPGEQVNSIGFRIVRPVHE
jgi:formylglycine-generating enzyme required for sulfatase activity